MTIDLTKSTSPFSLREKALRALWTYFTWPLVSSLPRPFGSTVRVLVLRFFGAQIGKCCLIESGCLVWIPWNLELSDYVAIGRAVEIYNYSRIRIERMTVVSQYCYLCTGSHDYTHPHMPLTWADIRIGSMCWIAAGSWVLPGVYIGDGTVVGARSLVNKSLPEWSVCAGHPCVPLKVRRLQSIT